jgi:saccharopine dehydrogenase-like NADP-dependent oxidoreductase
MGAMLMKRGKISGKGVMPPEACINPMDFLALMPEVIDLEKNKASGKGFSGLLVESVDAQGNKTKMNI